MLAGTLLLATPLSSCAVVKIAKVALYIPGSPPYDYAIADRLVPFVRAGVRAVVPLRGRTVLGIVVAVPEKAVEPNDKLKGIIDVLDRQSPLLSAQMLEFTRWAAGYYLVGWGEILQLCLSKTGIAPVFRLDRSSPYFVRLPPGEQEELLAYDGQPYKPDSLSPVDQELADQGVLWAGFADILPPGQSDLLQSIFCRGESNYKPRAHSQAFRILALFEQNAQLSAEQILQQQPKARPILRQLVRRGVLQEIAAQSEQLHQSTQALPQFELLEQQRQASNTICAAVREARFQPYLLFGITGSGKTEVYLQAAAECLSHKKSVLCLVPEIVLSLQIRQSFLERFGDIVRIQHSGLTARERRREKDRITSDDYSVVIGARSALFAHTPKLGLIIIDEEHDASFKQQGSPCYNARDLAVVLARQCSIPIVLGSATPSVESFHNAQAGKYTLLRMTQRTTRQALPRCSIINLQQAARLPGVFYLSLQAYGKLQDCYARGQQSIVFLNRRGYAAVIQCTSCRTAITCPNCSISLTPHERGAAGHKSRQRKAGLTQLLCHHCGHQQDMPLECPACGGYTLRHEGIGTQRIAQDLTDLFPNARIARLDRDSMDSKEGQKQLEAIRRGEVDFIIGTQLISKGHDFPNIGLVCVLIADTALNIRSFRASERAFQVFSQVSGRAGRRVDEMGEAIIQTYNPMHPIIQFAAKHDYSGYFHYEMSKRTLLFDPPRAKMAIVRISHPEDEASQDIAQHIYASIAAQGRAHGVWVNGPYVPAIHKLQKRYYRQIMLRASHISILHKFCIACVVGKFRSKLGSRGRMLLNIDP